MSRVPNTYDFIAKCRNSQDYKLPNQTTLTLTKSSLTCKPLSGMHCPAVSLVWCCGQYDDGDRP